MQRAPLGVLLGRVVVGYATQPPRIDECRGMHASQWRADLGYWVCADCGIPLDEQRRPGGLTAKWLRERVRP